MPEPLLSIVVPTRNRFECAASLVRGLHASTEQGFELVLQDNSSDCRLGELVAQLEDPRIRYFHTTASLNMHGNFDHAIRQAQGRYICGLGDDDGIIVSEAIAVLTRAEQIDADAILTAVPSFGWPGLQHWLWGDVGGILENMTAGGVGEALLDPERELQRVFGQGVTEGLGKLPRVYQGFVSRRSLEALFARCGTYFPGPSPDMANAVGLVPFVNRIMLSRRPTVIAGHSPRSGGGTGAAGKHHGRLEDQPHLPPGTLEAWDEAIPRFWSGLTIYAQSAVVARRATAREAPRIAYHRLYAACLVYERRHYWSDVMRALRNGPGSHAAVAVRTALAAARLVAVRARTFIGNFLRHRLRRGGRERYRDMAEVMRECERHVAGADRGWAGARASETAPVSA